MGHWEEKHSGGRGCTGEGVHGPQYPEKRTWTAFEITLKNDDNSDV